MIHVTSAARIITMKEYQESLNLIAVIVVALALASWLLDRTVTTYWVYTGSGYPAARETYSVDRPSGTVSVLEQWPGNFVKGHKNCVIFDARNWSCPDAELWAQDGKVHEAILSTDPRLHEVTMLKWWFAKVTHSGRAPEDGKQ
jgi:hypothetical protein